jgi:hypothetical protein
MYKRRFADWDLHKVIREQDVVGLEEEIAKHRALHNRTPPMIKVNGRFIETKKAQRSIRRHHNRSRKGSNESSPSSGLSIPDTLSDVTDDVMIDASSDFTDDAMIDASSANDMNPGTDCVLQLSSDTAAAADDQDDEADSKRCPVVNLERGEAGVLLNLSIRELDSLSVVILQAAHHLGELQIRTTLNGLPQAFTACSIGLVPSTSPYLINISPSRDILDLESILYQASKYLSSINAKRRASLMASDQCSVQEAIQARDFYARYWLGLILGASTSHRDNTLAWSLYDDVFAQTAQVLKEDHPHFLAWICFVICYPPQWEHNIHEARYLQQKTLGYSQWMTESVAGRKDPRFIIQDRLRRSCHHREIALVLLRYIVDTFNKTTQSRNVQDLELLAQLFNNINQIRQMTEAEIEGILQSWAKTSLAIAEVIHKDHLLELCSNTIACAA